MAVLKLDSTNFEQEVLSADIPVLVDFWAEWCGPCRTVGPIVEKMADTYAGKLKVGKLNVDENRSLASKYAVMAIPTLVVFKNGAEAERMVGFQGPSQLQRLIESHI